ncbi:MAG: nucleoid-associated protein YgaU, partial [Janthinobacterium sp.]
MLLSVFLASSVFVALSPTSWHVQAGPIASLYPMSHFTGISMKNFSTVATRLVIVVFFSNLVAAAAQAQVADNSCAFLPNAPSQHLVVKRDTLWDISGKFLAHPWCWGRVWGMNREEIRNPHWIYPGQIVYLDRAAGRLRLGSGAGVGS